MWAKPINVLLVTDQAEVRGRVAASLAKTPKIRLAEIRDSSSDSMILIHVLIHYKRNTPDVIVLDMDSPKFKDGWHKSRIMQGVAVLGLATASNESFVVQLIKNGVSGFLRKDSVADQLALAVQEVAQGKLFVDATVAGISKEAMEQMRTACRKIARDLAANRPVDVFPTGLTFSPVKIDIEAMRRKSKKQDKPPATGDAVGAKPKGNGGTLGGFADSGDTKPQASGNYPTEKPKTFGMEDREARKNGPPRIPPKKKRRRRGPDTKSSR